MVKHITDTLDAQPFTQPNMEAALLKMNALPGITARGQLQPQADGTVDLVITASETPWQGVASFSNAGTRYLGPNQVDGQLVFNNVF